MPKRKIGSMPAKPSQQRTKERQKKEKPLLKTRTVSNIKIPHIKTTRSDIENQHANQTKINKNNIKIMLANEVIRLQFPKKLKEPIKEIQVDKPNKRTIRNKPILNHNRVLRNSIIVSEENDIEECSTREPAKRRSCKILAKQINAKLMEKLPEDPGNRVVVSPKPAKKETSKPVNLRRRKAVVQSVNASAEENVSPDNKVLPSKPKTVPKRKLSVNSKPGPMMTRKRKLDGAIKDVKEEVLKDIPKEETEETEMPSVVQTDLLSSSLSESSWTKDISSSSASLVTVSSRDFYRIDKKLPLVKLNNMDLRFKYSDDISMSNVSDSVCTDNSGSESYINIPYPSLRLSTPSSCYSQKVQSPKNVVLNKLGKTLNKLSSTLNSFDLELIDWIGCTNEKTNNITDILYDKVIQDGFLKEERDVIVTCNEINRILSNNPNIDTETKNSPTKEVETNSINISNELVLNKDLQNEESRKVFSPEANTDVNNLISKQNIPLEDNDDDDALSLFAESITGIVSSRRSSYTAGTSDLPEVEEYIPEPVFKNTFRSPEISYKPSRITAIDRTDVEDNNVMTSNFCEKQNADSTSIYKENESFYNNLIYEDRIGYFPKNTQINSNDIQKNTSSPRLMASIHKPKQGIHSYLFKGVCFFYLISSCKKTICNFPHNVIDIQEIKNKFALISEQKFIEEYMLVRTWPQLRRKYGKCFVEECIRRELSRFAVEMAIDFVMKAKENSRDDNILKIDIVENILLYLKQVDLNTCADLLSYKVHNFTGLLLCDFFMNTIAESQNFSQFKTVFISLTEFMCNIQRIFDINAATLILERVSILPYDEGLARALIKIIKNTDTAILSNSMIQNLEMRLMSSNLGLYDELMGLHEKIHTNHTVLSCFDKMSNESTTSSKINNNLVLNNDIRYSPDTTNLDNMNKTLEPIITRTIDLNKIQPHLNDQIPKSNGNVSKRKYNNWANRTVFDNIRYKQTMNPPRRPGFKQKSDQNLETRPSVRVINSI